MADPRGFSIKRVVYQPRNYKQWKKAVRAEIFNKSPLALQILDGVHECPLPPGEAAGEEGKQDSDQFRTPKSSFYIVGERKKDTSSDEGRSSESDSGDEADDELSLARDLRDALSRPYQYAFQNWIEHFLYFANLLVVFLGGLYTGLSIVEVSTAVHVSHAACTRTRH